MREMVVIRAWTRYVRGAAAAACMLGAPAPKFVNAQAAPSAPAVPFELLSLPEPGARCRVLPADGDSKRLGIWQLFSIETRAPKRVIALGLDAKQRIKFLTLPLSAGAPRFAFDTTGHVMRATRGDSTQDARARLLAIAVRDRCAPLPPVEGVGQPIAAAPHTTVFARIPRDFGECRTLPSVSDTLRAHGVTRFISLSLRYPFRMVGIGTDATGALRSFSTFVAWGAMTPAERESAVASFDANGTVVTGTKFLGYIGADGKGATYRLRSPEIDTVRALAADVLRRCAGSP